MEWNHGNMWWEEITEGAANTAAYSLAQDGWGGNRISNFCNEGIRLMWCEGRAHCIDKKDRYLSCMYTKLSLK
jgi:hypothetical protein